MDKFVIRKRKSNEISTSTVDANVDIPSTPKKSSSSSAPELPITSPPSESSLPHTVLPSVLTHTPTQLPSTSARSELQVPTLMANIPDSTDIAFYLNKTIKNEEKIEILKNIAISKDYVFPVMVFKNKHLKCQHAWFERFK